MLDVAGRDREDNRPSRRGFWRLFSADTDSCWGFGVVIVMWCFVLLWFRSVGFRSPWISGGCVVGGVFLIIERPSENLIEYFQLSSIERSKQQTK